MLWLSTLTSPMTLTLDFQGKIFYFLVNQPTHWGLVTYGIMDLGQLWFRLWCVACLLPSLFSIELFETNLSEILLKIHMFSLKKMHLKNVNHFVGILVCQAALFLIFMKTSSNGNIFRITGHLCGEFTSYRWIPRTKASNAELWGFLWSVPE